MKYLHDNGFKVIRMSDLGFSPRNNMLYVKADHRNNVNVKSQHNENLDQEYKKWHYFSSSKTNSTAYSLFNSTTAA